MTTAECCNLAGVDLASARNYLEHGLGKSPTVSELAEYLSMDRDDVVDMVVRCSCGRRGGGGGEEFSRLGRGVVPDTVDFDAAGLSDLADRKAVWQLIAALPETERNVLVLRIFRLQRVSQISKLLGLTPMRVSRLLANSLAAMRDQLRE